MDSGGRMGVCPSMESGVGVLSGNDCMFAAMALTLVWRRRRVSK